MTTQRQIENLRDSLHLQGGRSDARLAVDSAVVAPLPAMGPATGATDQLGR